jgi:two-component system, OmpR family, manganese sensing sensor histidine kinase
MFQKIQRRLLWSNLLVFASILGIFAIAVRTVFAHSLNNQFNDELTALGQGAVGNAEFDNGHIKIESDFPIQGLIARHQGLQWFDLQGHLIFQQGKSVLNLPLSIEQNTQFQSDKIRIKAIILPIIGSDEHKLIGYVRASQSLEEFDENLNKLDWGLGGGIAVALALSSIGGIWLTRQAMHPIEESFQRLKQFTADASHELRSPLMAIKSNAAVALKYPEGMRETDVEKFQAISSATSQMTRLTEDLLFLARNDNVLPGNWDTVNLNSILSNLLQLYKTQYEAKNIKLKSQFSGNLNLLGDPIQLTRLFANLIENALHYTQSGGVVEIKTSRVSAQLVVSVHDTGMGIAPENIEKVFERFWRADKSRSYNRGGSGLGLAIASAIAHHHGGLITVTSQLDTGTCFTVCLPGSK